MNYKPVIGLEIHAELNTRTKMFCDSLNNADETKPNVNVCPICLAHPGAMPVINIEAVNKVIKTGLAVGAKIILHSWFERKNYFYPDLPKGYQISQFQAPLCQGGILKLSGGKEIRIRRIHLEEDTGKLIHEGFSTSRSDSLGTEPSGRTSDESSNSMSSGRSASLIDFNRAGVPLMELVTEPDIESGAEAKEFGEEFQLLLRYLDVSGADMEKGQFRLEANVSICPLGDSELGTKVELKNINSFRVLERAINYELKRQQKILEKGEKIVQETRGWNESEGRSFSQRIKEESHDYRYFPEPDLPPLRLAQEQIDFIKTQLPELPAQRRDRFNKEYAISLADAQVFTAHKELGDYFEQTVSELKHWASDSQLADKIVIDRLIKLAANYLITELQKLLFISTAKISDLKITPEDFAELIILIQKGDISSSGAQEIFKTMFATGEDPHQILMDKGLAQVSNRDELAKAALEVLAQNPKAVEDYKKGKAESLKFLVGQLMRVTKGSANPQIGEEVLKEALK